MNGETGMLLLIRGMILKEQAENPTENQANNQDSTIRKNSIFLYGFVLVWAWRVTPGDRATTIKATYLYLFSAFRKTTFTIPEDFN